MKLLSKSLLLFMPILFGINYSLTAEASVSFKASYRESTNRFQILDCVAQWWDYCMDDGEYRAEWIRRFGPLDNTDLELFSQYKQIRESYMASSNESSDPLFRKDGLFARNSTKTEDPFATIFYSSENESQSYKKLTALISPSELAWLKAFYAHFEPRTSVLLAESKTPFEKWVKKLNSDLSDPDYPGFFEKLLYFYNVSTNINYEVLITWWPPINRNMASPTDTYLVFQKNPIKHMSENDLPIVFHEVVHTLSSRQSLQQKQELTKNFLNICPVKDRLKRGNILEEPLAVALGQIAFLDQFFPAELHFEESFYNNPWISSYGKAIYPVLKSEINSGKTITDGFILKAADQCKEFVQALDLLKPNPT